MVANGVGYYASSSNQFCHFQEISTFVYLNFEKEEANSKVVIPSSVNIHDPSLEQVTVKRLKSVEKGCKRKGYSIRRFCSGVYPYISMSFIKGSNPDKNNNINLSLPANELGGIRTSSSYSISPGLFECLQTITELPKGRRLHKNRAKKTGISDDGTYS